MKTKGYKSTEFWLSCAAMVLGAVASSGALAEDGSAYKYVGLGVSLLAAMGYTAGRSYFKAKKG